MVGHRSLAVLAEIKSESLELELRFRAVINGLKVVTERRSIMELRSQHSDRSSVWNLLSRGPSISDGLGRWLRPCVVVVEGGRDGSVGVLE